MDTNKHKFNSQNMQKTVVFDGKRYYISDHLTKQIGFLSGMIESEMFDDLELPLHNNTQCCVMGHQLLGFMENNSDIGINYLQSVILGGFNKHEYIEQLKITHGLEINTGNMSKKIRDILTQVFVLLSLADYWDCQLIIKDCTEFVAMCLSVTDTHSVKEWFAGIV